MGIVCDVLTHLAIGVGNVLGVAIRLGHGEVGRSGPRPRVKIAAPVHGIPTVSAGR
jgi:hypothetical protein